MCDIVTAAPAFQSSNFFSSNSTGDCGGLRRSHSSIDVRNRYITSTLGKRIGSFEDLAHLAERVQGRISMDAGGPTSSAVGSERPTAPITNGATPTSTPPLPPQQPLQQSYRLEPPRDGGNIVGNAPVYPPLSSADDTPFAESGVFPVAEIEVDVATKVSLTSSSLAAANGASTSPHDMPFANGAGFSPRSGTSSPPQGSSIGRRSLELDSRRSSMDLGPCGPTGGHLSEGHAAEELFYRLNHARQTVDYVKRQAAAFSQLNRAEMDVWEALDLLNGLREYEAALLGGGPDVGEMTCDPEMSLLDHALQTAEACRVAFPEHDWMALVGLLHGLGKLLAHQQFGAEPQWAICGESFPVGCKFHPAIVHSQYFQANPDRRRRGYASSTGVYAPRCGLNSVLMSWSGAEYLYLVLAKNRTALPPQALFLIRHQKFAAVLRAGQPYGDLLSESDKAMLPTLKRFRELSMYRRRPAVPGQLEGDALKAHYDALLNKYIPQGKLRW